MRRCWPLQVIITKLTISIWSGVEVSGEGTAVETSSHNIAGSFDHSQFCTHLARVVRIYYSSRYSCWRAYLARLLYKGTILSDPRHSRSVMAEAKLQRFCAVHDKSATLLLRKTQFDMLVAGNLLAESKARRSEALSLVSWRP
jgi:hypothetical protein